MLQTKFVENIKIHNFILCSWFRTLQDFVNNCLTSCDNYQSIYLLQGQSTCFGCRRTHHQEYIKQ